MTPLFPLGQVVATSGALALLEKLNTAPSTYLDRHGSGDWGDVSAEDRAANDAAVRSDGRILSSYQTTEGRLWVITEWDRSVTTLLLPEEY